MIERIRRDHVLEQIRSIFELTLPLLVLRVVADHANGPSTSDDPAFVTHLPHRCSNLHVLLPTLSIRALPLA